MNYLIKTGKHHSKRFPVLLLWKSKLHYSIRFDSSAIYNSREVENQHDINKLVGFSDGFSWGRRLIYQSTSKGWRNSARIGWNWNPLNHCVDLWAYAYTSGKLQVKHLGEIAIGEEFQIVLQKAGDFYQFFLFKTGINPEGFELVELKRSTRGGRIFGFKQYPYFGGNETAPHNINISVKKL